MKNVPFHAGTSFDAAPAEERFAATASGSGIARTTNALSSSDMYCANSSRVSFGRSAAFGAAASEPVFDLEAVLLLWTSLKKDSIHAERAEAKSGSSHSAYSELLLRISPDGVPCQ